MIKQVFPCPDCGAVLHLGVALVRPRVKCPSCGARFRPPGATRFGVAVGPPARRLGQLTFRSSN